MRIGKTSRLSRGCWRPSDTASGEGGIRSRDSRCHQQFRRDSKPSIHQIHSKAEYQVQNRYSVLPSATRRVAVSRGVRKNVRRTPSSSSRMRTRGRAPSPQVSVPVAENWREGLSEAGFPHDEVKGPVGGSAGPSVLREPLLLNADGLVHSAHTAAALHRRILLLFRNIADERFGGE